MTRLLTLLIYLWQKKALLITPALLLPLIAFIWSYNYQPYFEAVTTLGLDKRHVSSPLLKNIDTPENAEILQRRLTNQNLLKDTLVESSVIFDATTSSETDIRAQISAFAKRIQLNIIDSESMQIFYRDSDKENAQRILENLSSNFVDDILAPERLRIEEKLMNLSNQVQYYNEQQKRSEAKLNQAQEKLTKTRNEKEQNTLLKDVVSLEFEVQKAVAQKDLAQEDYERLLIESRSLITGTRNGRGNLILQYIETPVVTSGERGLKDHFSIAWLCFKIGFFIGILSIIISRLLDQSLRSDEEIHELLGLKILGRIPNLGHVEMKQGRLIINPTKTTFK